MLPATSRAVMAVVVACVLSVVLIAVVLSPAEAPSSSPRTKSTTSLQLNFEDSLSPATKLGLKKLGKKIVKATKKKASSVVKAVAADVSRNLPTEPKPPKTGEDNADDCVDCPSYVEATAAAKLDRLWAKIEVCVPWPALVEHPAQSTFDLVQPHNTPLARIG